MDPAWLLFISAFAMGVSVMSAGVSFKEGRRALFAVCVVLIFLNGACAWHWISAVSAQ